MKIKVNLTTRGNGADRKSIIAAAEYYTEKFLKDINSNYGNWDRYKALKEDVEHELIINNGIELTYRPEDTYTTFEFIIDLRKLKAEIRRELKEKEE